MTLAAVSATGGHPLWHLLIAPIGSVALYLGIKAHEGRSRLRSRRGPVRPSAAAPRLPPLLGGWVAGSMLYLAVVTGLAHWPAIIQARGQGGPARPLVLLSTTAVVVALALLASSRPEGGRHTRPRSRTLAFPLWLVGCGAAWTAWGIVDQHVLNAFQLTSQSASAAAWDAVFHGMGVMICGVGTWRLITARSADRPSHRAAAPKS